MSTKQNKFKKTHILVAAVLLLAVLISLIGGAFISGAFKVKTTETKDSNHNYRFLTLSNDSLSLTGKIVASQSQTLDRPNGRLIALKIKTGDTVTKNQLLMTTYDGSYHNVYAPYNGSVVVKDSEGNANIEIYSDQLLLSASVSEYDYSKVQVGQSVQVASIANGYEQTTQISSLAKDPQVSSLSTTAKYALSANLDRGFIDGQSVKITVLSSQFKIPTGSVKKNTVYLLKNGRAIKRRIKADKESSYYLVTSGLKTGDRLILNPDKRLKNGCKVNE